jgi:hypothetical protein
METDRIEIDRKTARELYRKYKEHRAYSAPIDKEIQRAYQLIAQGRMIIRAIQSVASAGQHEDGTPKLALARADAKEVRVSIRPDGGAVMTTRAVFRQPRRRGISDQRFEWPDGTFPRKLTQPNHWGGTRREYEAPLPLVPVDLRPKRGLENYHVLWEVDQWRPTPPLDPMLLRRVGKSDLWTVVAAWDLSPVERAVMATRL